MAADIEKVIKGLECCSEPSESGVLCSECPYWGDNENKDELVHCNDNLCKDALELLKEQEAKTGEWIYKHDNLWHCSRCGEIIYSETDDDLEIHHAYCSRCGAKMKQEGR